MKEDDIKKVMELFSVTRERAIDIIEKGINLSALRGGYDLMGHELSRITEKYKPVIDELAKKIGDVAGNVKQDFQGSFEKVREEFRKQVQ